MEDKYTKVVYESSPIGKEKIILYLTTFDLKRFKQDEELRKIPTKRTAIQYEFDRFESMNNQKLITDMQIQYDTFIRNVYEQQLKEMQEYIEYLRNSTSMPTARWYENRR